MLTVDPGGVDRTVNSERVNGQQLRRLTINMLTVDPGGGGGVDQQSTVRGSTVNSEVISNQHC